MFSAYLLKRQLDRAFSEIIAGSIQACGFSRLDDSTGFETVRFEMIISVSTISASSLLMKASGEESYGR